ncbi:ABC transporter substrate-binding protein [Azovibrio restrictus]|uniref:ABC transporter substrate-binding protein n=1 Tax=Azovibrio restrictus TaxID=146938 RepID=UPI0026F00F91|nr:ABC transporter substrate-binding protein [Azovibrio restrictus]MDD3482567.1 ABC transporter substrate-binding protein [Azovibrio restrictus]
MKHYLLALLLAAAGIAGAQEDTIRIGVIGPFSGQSSVDMGESIKGGARVFAAEANQLSMLLGKKIVLVEKDDQAKPDVGVARSKELIEQEKVVAVVGFANYGVLAQAAPLFQNARIPLIVSASAGGDITRQQKLAPGTPNYIFRLVGRDALQTHAMLKDLVDRHKYKKIAILHDTSPYGEAGRQNALDDLKQRQMNPVAVEAFKVGDTDMSEQLARAQQAGAEAIAMYGLAAEGAMVMKSLARMNWKVPVVATWTASQRSFLELGGSAVEGTRMAVTYVENELGGVSHEFSRNYQRINNTRFIPSGVAAAQTYDALRLLYMALTLCNCSKSEELQKALERLDQPSQSTVIARFNHPFSATNHEAITAEMVVMGEIRKGKIVYAYKDEEQAAQAARRAR